MLTELDTVKSELGITDASDDTYLTRMINVYSDLFSQLTDRNWTYETDYTERIDIPVGQVRISVSNHVPLDSITSITIDGDVIDAADYEIEDKDLGFIRMKSGVWENTAYSLGRYITITATGTEMTCVVEYDGGYVTPKQATDDPSLTRSLAYDIEQAVIDAVTFAYHNRGTNQNVSSYSLGDYSESLGSKRVSERGLPDSFEAAVSRYRKVTVL